MGRPITALSHFPRCVNWNAIPHGDTEREGAREGGKEEDKKRNSLLAMYVAPMFTSQSIKRWHCKIKTQVTVAYL